MIEATPGAVAIPLIVRKAMQCNAHVRSVGDITAEIRSIQDQSESVDFTGEELGDGCGGVIT